MVMYKKNHFYNYILQKTISLTSATVKYKIERETKNTKIDEVKMYS